MVIKHELDPLYTYTFQIDGAWYWRRLDDFGDPIGESVGPFISRHEAQRHAGRIRAEERECEQ